MEARPIQAVLLAAVLFVSMGARVRTPNFIIETPDPKLAQQFGVAAEKYRRDLAVEWLGKAMPNWSQPCFTTIEVGSRLSPGGATTFAFDRGEVFGWRMTIQGSPQRLLDSVLPHEILHTVLASHFRCPLPRWADEGAASSVEDASERNKHRRKLYEFLRTGRGIAFNRMFAIREYPADVMPLYAQGHSLATFLLQRGGPRKYVKFLEDGLHRGDWSGAIERQYGIGGTGPLQETWLAWVKQGSPMRPPTKTPPAAQPASEALALADHRPRPQPNLIYRVPKPAVSYAPGSVTPAESSGLVLVDPPPQPKTLPDTGWRPAGNPAPPPALASASPAESSGPASSRPASSRPAAAWPTTSRPLMTAPPISPPVRSQLTRPQPYQCPSPMVSPWFGGG